MNSRYLFRGKTYSGNWVKGDLVNFVDMCSLETIGQSTGIKDKNGKLIFEDDRIKWKDYLRNGSGDFVWTEGIVRWSDKWAGFCCGKLTRLDHEFFGKYSEIINDKESNNE